MENKIIPSYFIPHWWGPWNLMWENHMKQTWEIILKNYFNQLWKKHSDVDVVVIVTSHWENKNIKISYIDNYELFYDYYWFPNSTYNVNYKVKWDKKLSEKIKLLLNKSWIESSFDEKRWLDHWSFVPLMEIFPKIKIPVVQVSISRNLDPKFHFELWKAISTLKKENILILASGMSYHNMTWFFSSNEKFYKDSIEFNNYLEENLKSIDNLINIPNLEITKKVHPRIEHFIPFYTILWTSINWELIQDIKTLNYWVEIVWYKTE